ncbi:MAG: DNA polymerase III subunit beta [Thomasclavelia sp.]|nr:DNA polymerase III subunit beta [Thomasclavelia sp.]
MKFRIKRLKLLNALAKATKAVSLKTPLAVLIGVKFELLSDRLILTGSDSDLTIRTVIKDDEDLEVIEEGSVVLNSRYVLDTVRKFDAEYLDIEIIDGFLTRITGDKSKIDLNGIDPIEYPRIDLSKTGSNFVMSSFLLKDIINETKFAASDKENKPVLTGINFKANNGQLECVATDSYRLAKKIVSLDNDISFNITIPKLSLDEISKIIEKDENMEIFVSDRKILFSLNNSLIQTRLIDGSFPDTARLIPSEYGHELTIDNLYLQSAIDRVSLLSTDQNNIIKLDMSEDRVILSSYSQEVGSAEENLSSAFFKGEPLTISFSSKYANDAIKSFNAGKIKICFTENNKPFVVTDYEKDDLLQLLLPVRTM